MEHRDDGDQARAQPHGQDRRRVAAQPRHAAADAGRRRPARPLQLQRLGHRAAERDMRRSRGVANSVGVVPARLAERRAARPQGHRRARARSTRPSSSSSRTSGRRGRTSRSTSACAGSTTRRSTGLEGAGSLSNYDPATNTLRVAGLRQHERRGRTSRTRSRTSTREPASPGVSNDETVVRAGYGGEHDSVPGQPLRVQLPGQAELLGHRPRTASRPRARWRPASRRRRCVNIPQDGIIPVTGSLLNSTYDVIPPDLREGTLHSWNVAFQRQLPFQLDGRHRLRRQPRRQPGHGHRRPTPAWCTARATPAGRSSRSSTAPARRARAATRTSPSTTRCR